MITVNGWCAGGKGGGRVFSQWGRWGKISVQTFSNLFLKILTEGAVTTKAGSLFQNFTTLTENADPLLHPCGLCCLLMRSFEKTSITYRHS